MYSDEGVFLLTLVENSGTATNRTVLQNENPFLNKSYKSNPRLNQGQTKTKSEINQKNVGFSTNFTKVHALKWYLF